MTPQTAGRFTLHRKLPAGGMGRVFEAEDPANGRRVALKLIDLGTDADSMQIVNAEKLGAELQSRLCAIDTRVTEIYEAGEMPNYFYIVMEYIDGQDLSEITIRQSLEAGFAARVAQDVLEVLDHAHNFVANVNGQSTRGIVHGDVKPRNIRLTSQGQVKVLDFGIAKALSMTRSFTQNIFGSVQYSSPERLRTGEVNVSSDLWGVAVVLYEMVAGRPFFEGENSAQLERMIRNYDYLPPFPVNWPESLRQVLGKALDPNPQVRYGSAAEFAEALRDFRKQLPATGQNNWLPSATPDVEATRRVSRESGVSGETLRSVAFPTVAGHAAQPEVEATRKSVREQNPAVRSSKIVPGPVVLRRRSVLADVLRTVAILVLCIFLIGAYLCVREYMVWRDADQLAQDLASEKQQDLDTAWQRYQKLAAKSHVPISLWSAQRALRNRLMSDADHAIARYRDSDAPPVSQTEWVHARNEVAHAVELAPNDKTDHGKLRLIDGHLARIRGTARHDPRLLEEARQDYEDSASFMKKSADPWLGLARLYIYSLHDVDGGEAAIKQAERRGHDIGKRETSELADGYRYRAERTIAIGDHPTTPVDAERYYAMATSDLSHARRLYQSILPWGNSVLSVKKLDELLNHISSKRSAMREH